MKLGTNNDLTGKGKFGNPLSRKAKHPVKGKEWRFRNCIHLFKANGWRYRNCVKCGALNNRFKRSKKDSNNSKSIMSRLLGRIKK